MKCFLVFENLIKKIKLQINTSNKPNRMSRLKKWVMVIVFGFLVCNLVWAIPGDWYYGKTVHYCDGQSIGLAGTSTLKSKSNFDKVGLISFIDTPQFILTYNLGFMSERRTKMLYDQFDNTVGEVAIAENLLTTGKLGTSGFVYPIKLLNLGLSIRPQYIFDYRFYQEFRDDFYAKIGEKEIKLSGAVYKTSFFVSKNFDRKIGVGAGINYFFGRRKFWYHDSIVYIRQLSAETTSSPKGVGFNLGIAFVPKPRLLIHLDYQSKTVLKNRTEVQNQVNQKYPDVLSWGINYLASGEIPTQIGLNGQYTNWKCIQANFSRTVEMGIGVEHIFLNGVAFRYGFRLEPSFIPPIVHQGAVCFGWGFEVGTMRFDIGADIKRRIMGSENLLFSNESDVKVYQNSGEIVITISKTL